jgi:hypothetical protein
MAIEEPAYEVLLETRYYEVRRYQPYIVAEVDVDDDFKRAGNSAFRVLAGYIFGDNEPQQKMEMTAPVESREGVRMNMTAPVTSQAGTGAGRYTYAFVMERKYTMDTLPEPTARRTRRGSGGNHGKPRLRALQRAVHAVVPAPQRDHGRDRMEGAGVGPVQAEPRACRAAASTSMCRMWTRKSRNTGSWSGSMMLMPGNPVSFSTRSSAAVVLVAGPATRSGRSP